MVKVRSFQGYLAKQFDADKIISPPYDVLNTEEAKEMAKGNDMCFLRVSKPEIDLPEGTDLYSSDVYAKGRSNLEYFMNQGYVVPDTEERMYLYMQRMGSREQYGLVAMASVEDYEQGLIKRHELTIKKKEEDRTRLSDAQNANLGPVFLAFKGGEDIEKRMMEIASTEEPYARVDGEDGTEHVVWKCSKEDSAGFESGFAGIESTYIADGHHRAASAYNVGKLRRQQAKEEGKDLTGEEPFLFFMAIHYPESNLQILDYNRVLKTLNGLAPDAFLGQVSQSYEITGPLDESLPRPSQKGECCLYLEH
jgi:uncharacterized protein (DUF1015 family)